jgi:hypothetical protein
MNGKNDTEEPEPMKETEKLQDISVISRTLKESNK